MTYLSVWLFILDREVIARSGSSILGSSRSFALLSPVIAVTAYITFSEENIVANDLTYHTANGIKVLA